jgi:hypothetical protein
VADTLNQNQQLTTGQRLSSNNGRVELIMQGDGNLVIYRRVFGHPLWASNTNGRPATHAIMQTDGNFVVYAANNMPFWATGTDGHPGSRVVLQDDGNLVVYNPANQPLWASNTVQNWSSPTFGYGDGRGYSYVETSESWKALCQDVPCFLALQWPDYTTTKFETILKGQPAVIQPWKGWCQKFLGLSNFPGGVGGEVGVYRRMPGRERPNVLPGIPEPLASMILGVINALPENDFWWPAPDLVDSIQFTLINPVNNTVFFSTEAEPTYWDCKWMNDGAYSKYQRDQGKRWWWIPSWFPGNSNTPTFSANYKMNLTVNGQNFTWT